ncbi:MAG: hypothetical protein QM726_09180 [Chitinophagaceae bacterium]
MEPEEIAQAWHSQDDQSLFQINMQNMQQLVAVKKRQSAHVTRLSEWVLILVNIFAGGFILLANKSKGLPNLLMLMLGIWMLCCALMISIARWKRLQANKRFNRSVQGELQEAFSNALYQLRLSQLMRWNTLIIALFIIPVMLLSHKPLWIAALLVAGFALSAWVSRWEHNWHKKRVDNLKALQKQLQNS